MVRHNPIANRRFHSPASSPVETPLNLTVSKAIEKMSAMNPFTRALKAAEALRVENEQLLKKALLQPPPVVNAEKIKAALILLRECTPTGLLQKAEAVGILAMAVDAGAFSGSEWTAWRTLVAANPTIENAYKRLIESSPVANRGEKYDGPARWTNSAEMRFLADCTKRFAAVIKAVRPAKMAQLISSVNKIANETSSVRSDRRTIPMSKTQMAKLLGCSVKKLAIILRDHGLKMNVNRQTWTADMSNMDQNMRTRLNATPKPVN